MDLWIDRWKDGWLLWEDLKSLDGLMCHSALKGQSKSEGRGSGFCWVRGARPWQTDRPQLFDVHTRLFSLFSRSFSLETQRWCQQWLLTINVFDMRSNMRLDSRVFTLLAVFLLIWLLFKANMSLIISWWSADDVLTTRTVSKSQLKTLWLSHIKNMKVHWGVCSVCCRDYTNVLTSLVDVTDVQRTAAPFCHLPNARLCSKYKKHESMFWPCRKRAVGAEAAVLKNSNDVGAVNLHLTSKAFCFFPLKLFEEFFRAALECCCVLWQRSYFTASTRKHAGTEDSAFWSTHDVLIVC